MISFDNKALNAEKKFISNYIRTTKYTIVSFIPFGLLYQFMRFANVYFLIVAVLQSNPVVSPLHPATAILPLIFVLTLSLLREGFEDYGRFKSDKTQNN